MVVALVIRCGLVLVEAFHDDLPGEAVVAAGRTASGVSGRG